MLYFGTALQKTANKYFNQRKYGKALKSYKEAHANILSYLSSVPRYSQREIDHTLCEIYQAIIECNIHGIITEPTSEEEIVKNNQCLEEAENHIKLLKGLLNTIDESNFIHKKYSASLLSMEQLIPSKKHYFHWNFVASLENQKKHFSVEELKSIYFHSKEAVDHFKKIQNFDEKECDSMVKHSLYLLEKLGDECVDEAKKEALPKNKIKYYKEAEEYYRKLISQLSDARKIIKIHLSLIAMWEDLYFFTQDISYLIQIQFYIEERQLKEKCEGMARLELYDTQLKIAEIAGEKSLYKKEDIAASVLSLIDQLKPDLSIEWILNLCEKSKNLIKDREEKVESKERKVESKEEHIEMKQEQKVEKIQSLKRKPDREESLGVEHKELVKDKKEGEELLSEHTPKRPKATKSIRFSNTLLFFSSSDKKEEPILSYQHTQQKIRDKLSVMINYLLDRQSEQYKINRFIANILSLFADFHWKKIQEKEELYKGKSSALFVMMNELYGEALRFYPEHEIVKKQKEKLLKERASIFSNRSHFVSEEDEKEVIKCEDISMLENMIDVFRGYVHDHFIQLEVIISNEDHLSQLMDKMFHYIEEKIKKHLLVPKDIFDEVYPYSRKRM